MLKYFFVKKNKILYIMGLSKETINPEWLKIDQIRSIYKKYEFLFWLSNELAYKSLYSFNHFKSFLNNKNNNKT